MPQHLPAHHNPVSIQGNWGAEPELPHKAAAQGKPLLCWDSGAIFGSQDLTNAQGYTSNRQQGYF